MGFAVAFGRAVEARALALRAVEDEAAGAVDDLLVEGECCHVVERRPPSQPGRFGYLPSGGGGGGNIGGGGRGGGDNGMGVPDLNRRRGGAGGGNDGGGPRGGGWIGTFFFSKHWPLNVVSIKTANAPNRVSLRF